MRDTVRQPFTRLYAKKKHLNLPCFFLTNFSLFPHSQKTDVQETSGAPLEYNSSPDPAEPPDTRPSPRHPSSPDVGLCKADSETVTARATSQDWLYLHITPAGGGRVRAGLCPSLCCKWSLKSQLTALSSMSSGGGVLFAALATPLNTTRFNLMVSAG